MKQEEKQLLLQDLCMRLPYGVKATTTSNGWTGTYTITGYNNDRIYLDCPIYDEGDDEWLVESVKPYLRPMSSMTEEEKQELERLINEKLNGKDQEDDEWTPWVLHDTTGIRNSVGGERFYFDEMSFIYDWLNTHHFDYCGLIEKGLALPAPEGMYKTY